MRAYLMCVLASLSFLPAEPPTIVVIGGPQPLWLQIVSEYQRRHPLQPAVWEVRTTTEAAQADLVFAYYPTGEELKGSRRLSASRWLGFPTEFAAAVWTQPIDQEASARASAC